MRSADLQKADREGEAGWREMEGWGDGDGRMERWGGCRWRGGGVGRGAAAGETEVNGINWLKCYWLEPLASAASGCCSTGVSWQVIGKTCRRPTCPDSNAVLLLLLLLRLIAAQTGSGVTELVFST